MMRFFVLAFVFLFCVAAMVNAGYPADRDCKVKILVRDFQHPGLRSNRGQLVAEIIAAEIEASGLAEALRPKCRVVSEYDIDFTGIKADDITQDKDGNWNTDKVDAYGAVKKVTVRREVGAPDADFEITGTVGCLEKKWWVRAILKGRTTGERLGQASASAEEADKFPDAAREVAKKLQAAYASIVFERRTEAVLRAINGGILTPEVAAEELVAMHVKTPAAFEPCAAMLVLLKRAKSRDYKLIIKWATLTVERTVAAGQRGKRYVMRHGIFPFKMLADAYEAEGRLDVAADTHRQAIRTTTLAPHKHWRELIRLETKLGRNDKLVEAYRGALKHHPENARLQLDCAKLLTKLGKTKEAVPYYRAYLKLKPYASNAGEIRAVLSAQP